MKMKSKRQFLFDRAVLAVGQEFETSDTHGKELLARGLAVEVTLDQKPDGQEPAARKSKKTDAKPLKDE